MEYWRLSAESRYGAQDTDPEFRAALVAQARQISAACFLSGMPVLLKWRRPSGVVKAENQLGFAGCL
jgi:hypothetical protein